MAYNFNQYPYTNYGYQQPNYYGGYQQQYMQPQPQVQAQQQTSYFPLTFVSGVEGAKAFIVQPNSTFYLLDSEDPDRLFIKSADKDGRYRIVVKRLIDDNAPQQVQPISTDITRLEEKIDKIYAQLLPKEE